jgi:hypothetical protein
MNNKFIKVLFIINGILIPVFILTILGIILTEYVANRSGSYNEVINDYEPEYIIEHSSPNEIVNSENYYVSKYKVDEIYNLLGSPEMEIGELPDNTINIVFLNKDFEKIGNLLLEDASIKHIKIPNFFSNKEEEIKLTKNITYLIAAEDTNEDDNIDSDDDHYLYISDLSGLNLKKVLNKKIKEYKFISDFKEILITYYENENELSIGVYNIDKNDFTKKSSLNFTN